MKPYAQIIKICGIKTEPCVKAAIQLGANYIGLIFYQKSNRYIEPIMATQLTQLIQKANATAVGVFVDSDATQMRMICQQTGIKVVQLHGAIARQNHHLLPDNLQRIYVRHVTKQGELIADVDAGMKYLDVQRDLLLFDGVEGGTGQRFLWKNFINPESFQFLLAGGLTPANVKEAIQICQPNGVDVSSGVENLSGKKDFYLMKQFIEAVRATHE